MTQLRFYPFHKSSDSDIQGPKEGSLALFFAATEGSDELL